MRNPAKRLYKNLKSASEECVSGYLSEFLKKPEAFLIKNYPHFKNYKDSQF